jgi:putative transposase
MARKPRIHVSGGFYHVILRGNARQDLFLNHDDRDIWQSIVRRVFSEYGHRLHAFCWMTNHVHMAVQAGNAPLAKAMSFLGSQYARRFNLRHHKSGHLFERRYRAIIVQEGEYLKELVRYIHMNPVRAKMVEHPGDYKWSSHNVYLGDKAYAWLTDEYVLSLFGRTRYQAVRSYSVFMDETPPSSEGAALCRGGVDDRALGNDSWLVGVLEGEYVGAPKQTLQDIISAICHAHQVDEASLAAPRGPHRNAEIRAQIAMEAADAGVATISEVARRFNRTQSVLSQTIRRLRQKNL